jgi:hypothetical protein
MVTGNDNKDEIEVWKHGWQFNYLIGQLNYVSGLYNKKIEAYIENEYYFDELQFQKSENVSLINKQIDLDLVHDLLKSGEVIVYLDCYYLQGILHAPHFVVTTRQTREGFEIADPADGKLKIISIKTMQDAVESLRDHLKYSPVLVTVNK